MRADVRSSVVREAEPAVLVRCSEVQTVVQPLVLIFPDVEIETTFAFSALSFLLSFPFLLSCHNPVDQIGWKRVQGT